MQLQERKKLIPHHRSLSGAWSFCNKGGRRGGVIRAGPRSLDAETDSKPIIILLTVLFF